MYHRIALLNAAVFFPDLETYLRAGRSPTLPPTALLTCSLWGQEYTVGCVEIAGSRVERNIAQYLIDEMPGPFTVLANCILK